MRFKFLLLLLFTTFIYLCFPSPAQAARQRARKPRSTGTYVSRGVTSYIRFRADRLGLLMNFSNFDNLESGRYEIVYDANGVPQGAGGSIILGDTSVKEILFATCSHGVCNFHENITNARLSIISVLKDGTIVLKPYRIRV